MKVGFGYMYLFRTTVLDNLECSPQDVRPSDLKELIVGVVRISLSEGAFVQKYAIIAERFLEHSRLLLRWSVWVKLLKR